MICAEIDLYRIVLHEDCVNHHTTGRHLELPRGRTRIKRDFNALGKTRNSDVDSLQRQISCIGRCGDFNDVADICGNDIRNTLRRIIEAERAVDNVPDDLVIQLRQGNNQGIDRFILRSHVSGAVGEALGSLQSVKVIAVCSGGKHCRLQFKQLERVAVLYRRGIAVGCNIDFCAGKRRAVVLHDTDRDRNFLLIFLQELGLHDDRALGHGEGKLFLFPVEATAQIFQRVVFLVPQQHVDA